LLAQALAPAVRVNAVAPGPTAPSAHAEGEAGLGLAEIQGTPLLRGSPPEAIADAVCASRRRDQRHGADHRGGWRRAYRMDDQDVTGVRSYGILLRFRGLQGIKAMAEIRRP
jgi:NAD(P)-dependent dehydrogenase (short-subunit alcohol dehydrogenase family)